jgi:vitamin B12 transporter
MNKHCLGVCALTWLVASQAAAQDATRAQPVTELKEIIVSGGLSPIEQRKSGRSISVIDAQTLEKSQVKYVADALRLIPGLHISRTANTGGQTVVRMRGSEANQTLVVIDGIVMNDVDQGAAYFENLLVGDIEQIEVLRGPQSALWGSNAMGGVINITTKSGESGKPQSSVLSEFGTNKSWLSTLSTRGGSEAVRYALSGSFNRSTGFNIATIGNEDDRDRNAVINGKLSVDLSEATTLDTSLRYVNRKSDFDATSAGKAVDADNYLTERTLSGGATLTNVSLDGALTQKLFATARDQERNNYSSSKFLSESSRYTAGYNATYRYDEIADQVHQLSGGYEWMREGYVSNYTDGEATRSTHAAIAEYRGEYWDQLFLTAGLRKEWNTDFSDATTWNVSGDWKIADHELRLHSSIGTAVTKPTFYEQFGSLSTFKGNPNLTPEKSFGWDLGVEKTLLDGGLILDVTYFNQNLTDEISRDYDSVTMLETLQNNDGESERQGIEVSAKLDFFNGLTASASYTYTDSTNQKLAGDPRLSSIRRPRHSGSISAAYVFAEDRARIFSEVVFNGQMFDEAYISGAATRVSLDGYTLVNIGGSYKVSDSVDVFARIENLFDKKYEEIYGYNTPGITGFAGIKASF